MIAGITMMFAMILSAGCFGSAPEQTAPEVTPTPEQTQLAEFCTVGSPVGCNDGDFMVVSQWNATDKVTKTCLVSAREGVLGPKGSISKCW
jgi:hypothetical protein